MTHPDLIARLSAHRLVGSVPPEEFAWVLAHGESRTYMPGDIITRKAAGSVEGIYFVLSGHMSIHVDRGSGPHKVLEWRAGDTTGLLPYSRMVVPPGDVVVEEPTEIFMIHRDHTREMIRSCHDLTSKLVHAMVDRARQFTSSDLHDEKMVSLGKLAAGLAHELNNPASALARGARLLPERLAVAEEASVALGAAGFSDDERAAIESVRNACEFAPLQRVRSPLEEADRESAMADWLEDHGADTALAEPLAESAVTIEGLDRLAGMLPSGSLEAALRWVAVGCSTRRLATELEEAAVRISDLITSVKGFTHMDLAAVPEPVDVALGLRQTLAVIQAKARGKSLGVEVVAAPDLPRVRGVAGELNQVWLNLIDNALDAAPESGRVEVRAEHRNGRVCVRVIDNGAGIPAELRNRIFDPFVTTKPVGQGTGLGLDISRRLVRRYDGDIEVDSQPGRTEFRVTFPALGVDTDGGR
jgi:signal transduction histidine kinase